jgi:hypothetical protein
MAAGDPRRRFGGQRSNPPTSGGTVSTRTSQPPVDLAPAPQPHPRLALALALISLPGVTITWDASVALGIVGTAIGIAAIVLGVQARTRLAGAPGTRTATTAVIIAALAVLSVVFFLIVGAPD